MSDYLKRLAVLKSYLKSNAFTTSQLVDMLGEENFIVSQRQIQRDLKSLYFIIEEGGELNTYFEEGKKYFYIKALSSPDHKLSFKTADNILTTRFSNQHLDKSKTKTIALIERSIYQQSALEASLVRDDETGDNLDLDSFQFTVFPLDIIYHRASYFLACYNPDKNIIEIFGIRQLGQIKLGKSFTGYKKYKSLLDIELSKRFGVTKNIDEKVYDIEIEFTSVTGRFIEDHFWHHSQKIIKLDGNYLLTFHCGINRELLGWIFQWMYNVKVLNPPKLKLLYERTLRECESTAKAEIPFVYRNIFTN